MTAGHPGFSRAMNEILKIKEENLHSRASQCQKRKIDIYQHRLAFQEAVTLLIKAQVPFLSQA